MKNLLTAVSTTAMIIAISASAVAQDAVNDAVTNVVEGAENAVEGVAATATDAVEGAKDAANDAVEGVKDAVTGASEATEDAVDAAQNEVSETVEAAEEAASDVTEGDATETAEDALAGENFEKVEGVTPEAFDISSVDLNEVVAKGDDFEIYVGDVLALMSELPDEYKQQDPAALYPELVNQLVSQEILAKEFDENSDEYKYKLRQAERAIAVNGALNAYLEDNLTDAYLTDTYNEAIGNIPDEEEFNASHILVETEDEAKAIIEEINGGADFAEVAKEKSTGPSGPQGGDLGWFGKGQMVPEFEEAVIALEPGAVSAEPVKTDFGYHVIKLNEKRVKPKPTQEEIGQQLEQYATQRLMDEKIQAARDGVDVEIIEGINPAILNAEF